MKKLLAILLVLCCTFALFANGAPEAPKAAPAASGKEAWGPAPEGTKEVLIWTFYGETMKNQYQQIVDAYNASQSKYHVTVEYQGGQAEVAAKLASTENSALPAAFHGAVENTAQFATSGYAVPMQEFIDLDEQGWPELATTWDAIKSAYQDQDGKLWAYPQGYSYGALFYNADMLKAAGIDPASIKCTDDLLAACRKLKEGGFCSTPIGFHPDGFYFNEMLAREGIMYYDNANGYKGDITKCLYVSDSKVNATIAKMLDFYQTLHKEGLAVPYGSNYQKEVLPEMGSHNCCFFIGVVSITTKILDVAKDFQVGVQPLISQPKVRERVRWPAEQVCSSPTTETSGHRKVLTSSPSSHPRQSRPVTSHQSQVTSHRTRVLTRARSTRDSLRSARHSQQSTRASLSPMIPETTRTSPSEHR